MLKDEPSEFEMPPSMIMFYLPTHRLTDRPTDKEEHRSSLPELKNIVVQNQLLKALECSKVFKRVQEGSRGLNVAVSESDEGLVY